MFSFSAMKTREMQSKTIHVFSNFPKNIPPASLDVCTNFHCQLAGVAWRSLPIPSAANFSAARLFRLPEWPERQATLATANSTPSPTKNPGYTFVVNAISDCFDDCQSETVCLNRAEWL